MKPRYALADTNVLLDIALPKRPQHIDAVSLLDEVSVNALTLCVSAGSLKDVYYLLTKYSNEVTARSYIKQLLVLVEIAPVDESICQLALASDEPDFEDGIIRACAELTGVDFILSRDENAFRTSPVRRLSPAEYMELFVRSEKIEL